MTTTDEQLTAPADESKPRAFAPSELVSCGVCARTNPPNRACCLYCGASLGMTEANTSEAVLAAEADVNSETTFHVITCESSQLEASKLNAIADELNLKPSELRSLLATTSGAPVAVATSERDAHTIAAKLKEHGLATRVISDEELALDDKPQVVSELEIHADKLTAIVGRGHGTLFASWSEIAVIVIGRLYFETREIEQKRNRSKHVVDEREILTDEAVLDIYARDDARGWRIRASNFDFSCLGEQKQLTAFANFTALTALLRERASTARVDDSYVSLRTALNSAWPDEPNAGAKQRRRSGLTEFDSCVTSVDNELQFTRYSRLLKYLHAANPEQHGAQT